MFLLVHKLNFTKTQIHISFNEVIMLANDNRRLKSLIFHQWLLVSMHVYVVPCPLIQNVDHTFLTAPDVSQVSIYMELSHIFKQGTACPVMGICTWWLEYTIPRPLDGLVLYWLENSILVWSWGWETWHITAIMISYQY